MYVSISSEFLLFTSNITAMLHILVFFRKMILEISPDGLVLSVWHCKVYVTGFSFREDLACELH